MQSDELSGFRRGVAEKISAVLWYSDLREFTRITDRAAPEQIIPLLNDYAEAVISAIYDNGGGGLKMIGGGTPAIFTPPPAGEARPHAITPPKRPPGTGGPPHQRPN